MCEYGPFIEYCCETYIHHDVLNIAVAAVMIFSALLIYGLLPAAYHLGKRRS